MFIRGEFVKKEILTYIDFLYEIFYKNIIIRQTLRGLVEVSSWNKNPTLKLVVKYRISFSGHPKKIPETYLKTSRCI